MPRPCARATVFHEVFGISFTEFILILVVALVVLGPQRLPGMLRTVGLWIHKLRQMTTEVRAQTGIDDLLRQEGFAGGLSELRSLLRGDPRALIRPSETHTPQSNEVDPYADPGDIDRSRERPVEGPDAQGALPDDLVEDTHVPPSQSSRPHADASDPGNGRELDSVDQGSRPHADAAPTTNASAANLPKLD